jgi:hypothetical protein
MLCMLYANYVIEKGLTLYLFSARCSSAEGPDSYASKCMWQPVRSRNLLMSQKSLSYHYQVNRMRFGFGTTAQKNAMPISKPIIIGCSTSTPAREAMAPVKNGNAAQPTEPKLAANPIARVRLDSLKILGMVDVCHVPIAPRWSSCGTTCVRT